MALNPLFEALGDDDDDDAGTPPVVTPPVVDPPAEVDPPAAPVVTPPVVTPPAPVVLDQNQLLDSAADLTHQMSKAIRQMERDLRDKNPELTDEDIDKISDTFSGGGARYVIDAVKGGIHLTYAKTIGYDRIKDNASKGITDQVPVGSTRSRQTGGNDVDLVGDLASTYGQYGKPTRAMKERLSKAARG